MPALPTNLRRDLERTVIKARDIAEAGAKQALEALTVHEAKAGGHLDAAGRTLRNRLRAHARQLGDARDARTNAQAIDRLTHECAYEHWHRMLFARFLAENDLLVEPASGVSVTLEEVEELARDAKPGSQVNGPWELASRYAQGALPQIFRPDDPVLAVELFPEVRAKLEDELEKIPRETFLADDSLGWVYQFWQSKRKDEVNASGEKITGDTLPAVTQLFTEHYMVEFLLHNTLGAWHAGKMLAARPELAASASSEQQLRDAVALGTAAGDIEWNYLRFVFDCSPPPGGEGSGEGGGAGEDAVVANPSPSPSLQGRGIGAWRPAAGVFPGWPREAKDLKVLDPCCGSGHFLVAAFHLLVRLRMQEEKLSAQDAAYAVLRDNLYALELDQRCVQLAAFNVALAAWTLVGRRIELPELHIACSGIGPSASEEEWIKLAEESGKPFPRGGAEPIRDGLRNLHSQFSKASSLGSLIDPTQHAADLITADYNMLRPYLNAALATERSGDEVRERAIAAAGMVKATELLVGDYTLVVTNVPFLTRLKQSSEIGEWADDHAPDAKADLSTVFLSRLLDLADNGGTIAAVAPQNWYFLSAYKRFRDRLTRNFSLNLMVRLGANAFQDMNWWAATTSLSIVSRTKPTGDTEFCGIDASESNLQSDKIAILNDTAPLSIRSIRQADIQIGPDCRIVFESHSGVERLDLLADGLQGVSTADLPRFSRAFWECPSRPAGWTFFQGSCDETTHFGGRFNVLNLATLEAEGDTLGAAIRGQKAWGERGIAIRQMRHLPATLFTGEAFDTNVAVILPRQAADIPAIWSFCSSPEFHECVRELDQKTNVTNATLVKVPFDKSHWNRVAQDQYPNGLPEPESNDLTQWLFHGNTAYAAPATILQVGVARLLGYSWPPEVEADIRLAAEARTLVNQCGELAPFADGDGIVCLPSVRSEASAAERLRVLLQAAFGNAWTTGKEADLLAAADSRGISLDEWLRTAFFEQHCKLFHHRPFIWHIWDGKKDGFHALVNYHKLAAHDGAGRRLLDKLTHVYLRDWIKSQSDGVQRGEAGAEARLAAAETLKRELEKILEGEPPYDLFVRWKPLHEQSMGWNPDINDGVRLNIRPFLMAKDVGRKGAGILRFKPNCKWDKDRGKEPQSIRPREDFPWFWSWDEHAQDFTGGSASSPNAFDGNRWNDLHYTNKFKQAARDRLAAT